MKLGELFRQLQGKQPVPSPVTGEFALFSKPDEQQKICDYRGDKLGQLLTDYPNIAAMAAYDTVFALNDQKKAIRILCEVSKNRGTARVNASLYAVNALRIKDEAPKEELAVFERFCAQAGFHFAELTKEQASEAIISDRIATAVKHHVDSIT